MPEKLVVSATFNGVKFSVGDRLQANAKADEENVCKEGRVVTIVYIRDQKDYVGIRSDEYIPAWGSLSGKTKDGFGRYVRLSEISLFFKHVGSEVLVIREDVFFKNRNLKGMKCRYLLSIEGGSQSFIELTENVGAGGADGLGKAGHCVLVPDDKLTRFKEEG